MPEPSAVTAAIARNVKAHRAHRGWSLEHLAARSGVSKGMLVQVEQARSNPSIATLCRISDALGIGLARIVEVADAPLVRVARADEVALLWTGERGSTGTLLVGADPPTEMELWDWRLEPGDAYDGEGHSTGSRELLTVLEGVLTLTVDGREEQVRTGDAALFSADRVHRYANTGTEPARFVLAVTQPTALLESASSGAEKPGGAAKPAKKVKPERRPPA